MNYDRCVIVSRHPDPEKTPRAVAGLQVCAGHRLKIERLIAELPALDDDLTAALTTSEHRDADQGRRKNGQVAGGVNLNEKIVEARGELHNELVRMVRRVSEERGFTVPADTIPALATWLTTQTEWLCAQPDADETHDYLDALSRSARSLAFPSGRRYFTIPNVTCRAPLWCDVASSEVTHCDGALVAVLMPDDDRENLSEITCDTCGLEVPLKAAALPGRWSAA